MRRILFVDDDPRFLEGLRRLLRHQRYAWEIACAPTGEAALALLEASAFDVIVSDLHMPRMDGAALMARVRQRFPQVVRIILSEHAEAATALQVVPVAHQFLAKPCDAEVLRVAIERACHLKAVLQDGSIRSAVGSLGELPSLPRVYQQLSLALADRDASLQKIASIVELDVGISAKILQLVNSSLFGIARSVTSIQDAVGYLGTELLRNLVLSEEVFRIFSTHWSMREFSLESLQRHARLAGHLASRLPVPKHLVDIAMIAGMLHDVGKLVMTLKLPGRFQELLAQAQEEECPLYKVEEREYGFSHAEVGAYLLGLWGLPYAVVEAVAIHHDPSRVPHRSFDATSAVHIANLLAQEMEPCHPLVWEEGLDAHQEYLASLGVQEMIPNWREMAVEVLALLV